VFKPPDPYLEEGRDGAGEGGRNNSRVGERGNEVVGKVRIRPFRQRRTKMHGVHLCRHLCPSLGSALDEKTDPLDLALQPHLVNCSRKV